jgi:hypothetical protein
VNGKRPGGWVALAWRNRSDPAWEGVSDAARLLWIDGLCWSGEHGTDGRVPLDLRRLAPGRHHSSLTKCAAQLIAKGWWVTYPDGGCGVPFDIWNRWQDTAEQRREARTRDADRKAKWRQTRRGTPPGRDATVGVGVGVGHSPLPPTPRPTAEEQDSESEGPARLGWEEYTDTAGRLYVRTTGNGQTAQLELDP